MITIIFQTAWHFPSESRPNFHTTIIIQTTIGSSISMKFAYQTENQKTHWPFAFSVCSSRARFCSKQNRHFNLRCVTPPPIKRNSICNVSCKDNSNLIIFYTSKFNNVYVIALYDCPTLAERILNSIGQAFCLIRKLHWAWRSIDICVEIHSHVIYIGEIVKKNPVYEIFNFS